MQMLTKAGWLVAAGALALAALSGPAAAQAAGTADAQPGAPAGFVAPAEPRPDETNAERAKTQPGNNAPFWRAVRESGNQTGVTNLPGAENGVLIQRFVQYPGSRFTTAGEAWREVRNRWLIPYGGSLLLIVVLALAMFYWARGPMGGHVPDTGRLVERFTFFERAAHWSAAIAFVVLAVSGIVMAFGKFFLLPVIGGLLFGWLTYALKTLHNFVGPLFAVALVVVFLTFIRDNLPRAGDLKWLAKGGGMLGERELPSHRFNAGEKVIFWGGVTALGLVVVASGLVLDGLVPGFGGVRGDMQVAHMVHAAASALMMAAFCGHIYLGTVGVKGVYQGMRTGFVDEGWAQEHHSLWYDDIRAGKIPARRSQAGAAASAASPQPRTS
jgi:formate dehydrogenase subunit gamma